MRSGRGIVLPLVFILAGLVFLAANFGYIAPINIGRAVALLWPLILMIVGIDLALARRFPLAALGGEVAVIALGIALIAVRPAGPDLFFRGPAAGDQNITVAREGAKTASLNVIVGGGTLRLSGGATALVEARSDTPDLTQRVSRRGDSADVRITMEDFRFGRAPANVDVKVASDVPLALNVSGGAGDFTLDLRDVTVTDLRVSAGASNLFLTLPKPSGELRARIDSGASSIVIEVPAGVEARVTASGGLISVSGRTETAGYGSAKDRVTISVSAGASSVTIR
ncbi:MAG: hypothetical protein HY071_03255 [Chloroflexi bacterium]|nr:hypothetical protein [Chloroflexota bacterium]